MSLKQYAKPAQLRSGYHQCLFCGEISPALLACKCSVKIKLHGNQEQIEDVLNLLNAQFEIIAQDEYFGGGVETPESYYWIAIKAPVKAELVKPGKP